ncbi:MAG: hypothetical protein ACJA0U_000620 [Salibacteraceae bacterium]|jgi:hypothetical protein
MKKSIFAFAIAGSMFLVSCGMEEENNNNEETEQPEESQDEAAEPTIIGTWQMTGFDDGYEPSAEEQAMNDKGLEELIKNTVYVFGEDGSLIVKTSMLGTIIEYEETYSIDGETLIMTSEEGEARPFNITVSDSELIMIQKDREYTIKSIFKRE